MVLVISKLENIHFEVNCMNLLQSFREHMQQSLRASRD